MTSRRRSFPFELPIGLRRAVCEWLYHIHPLPWWHLHRSFVPSEDDLLLRQLTGRRLLAIYGRVLALWIVPTADLGRLETVFGLKIAEALREAAVGLWSMRTDAAVLALSIPVVTGIPGVVQRHLGSLVEFRRRFVLVGIRLVYESA